MGDKEINLKDIRVRMAPSPTGWLHIGTARTALFNYLAAKHYGGKFILRIEDTDLERSNKEYEEDIIQGLKWLGMVWDEGPDVGGDYGPYRQTERISLYHKYLQQLLDEDKAYRCFCTTDELEAQKQEALSRGEQPKYIGKCGRLDKETVQKNISEGKESVIRFRMPSTIAKFKDLIRGEVRADLNLIGDIIIAKDLDTPLYNFAVVVDDALMKITHVIRGEDHLSNTPKQIAIAQALGFESPEFAHLPLILGPDRSKMSKRHGTVSIKDYQQEGYLPPALVNFIAMLGWHPSDNRELYDLESLIQEFTIERLQKSGAIFNVKKLDWFNLQYFKTINPQTLVEPAVKNLIDNHLITVNDDKVSYSIPGSQRVLDLNYITNAIALERPRLAKISDFTSIAEYLFKDDLNYSPELLRWHNAPWQEVILALNYTLDIIGALNLETYDSVSLQKVFNDFIDSKAPYNQDKGLLFWPLRVALSGKESSPTPAEIIMVLGKEESLKRLEFARNLILPLIS
jgi:nondiscriminating glutamyl-tRNA synthetase